MLSENKRTLEGAQALENRDWAKFGESHSYIVYTCRRLIGLSDCRRADGSLTRVVAEGLRGFDGQVRQK